MAAKVHHQHKFLHRSDLTDGFNGLECSQVVCRVTDEYKINIDYRLFVRDRLVLCPRTERSGMEGFRNGPQ